MGSDTSRPSEPPRRLLALARKIWPALAEMDARARRRGLSDLAGLLFSLPLALIGLAWLVSVTDLGLLRRAWPVLSLMAGRSTLFSHLSFFQFAAVLPAIGAPAAQIASAPHRSPTT